jgi:uncharacterized protein (UPF0332 family)
VRSLFNRHFVKTGKISKALAQIYNDLFARRQESDYIDFVRYLEDQDIEETLRYAAYLAEDETVEKDRNFNAIFWL